MGTCIDFALVKVSLTALCKAAEVKNGKARYKMLLLRMYLYFLVVSCCGTIVVKRFVMRHNNILNISGIWARAARPVLCIR